MGIHRARYICSDFDRLVNSTHTSGHFLYTAIFPASKTAKSARYELSKDISLNHREEITAHATIAASGDGRNFCHQDDGNDVVNRNGANPTMRCIRRVSKGINRSFARFSKFHLIIRSRTLVPYPHPLSASNRQAVFSYTRVSTRENLYCTETSHGNSISSPNSTGKVANKMRAMLPQRSWKAQRYY